MSPRSPDTRSACRQSNTKWEKECSLDVQLFIPGKDGVTQKLYGLAVSACWKLKDQFRAIKRVATGCNDNSVSSYQNNNQSCCVLAMEEDTFFDNASPQTTYLFSWDLCSCPFMISLLQWGNMRQMQSSDLTMWQKVCVGSKRAAANTKAICSLKCWGNINPLPWIQSSPSLISFRWSSVRTGTAEPLYWKPIRPA